jgi:hypothetical protein
MRLQWDFGGRTRVMAYDGATGESWRPSVHGGGESVIDAERLWGVTRKLYERAFYVRQGELVAVDDDDRAITQALEAIASSGARDESAQAALAALEHSLKEQIGTDRMSTKPLARARERHGRLERALEEAREQRDALEGVARERAAAVAAVAAKQRELDEARSLLDASSLRDLRKHLVVLR